MYLIIERYGLRHLVTKDKLIKNAHLVTKDKLIEYVNYLIDNIYVQVGDHIYRQVIDLSQTE